MVTYPDKTHVTAALVSEHSMAIGLPIVVTRVSTEHAHSCYLVRLQTDRKQQVACHALSAPDIWPLQAIATQFFRLALNLFAMRLFEWPAATQDVASRYAALHSTR
jgi:hypothetical protein